MTSFSSHIKSILSICILLISGVIGYTSAQSTTDILPVVQVNSYQIIHGIDAELQGFGSASIISSDGLLLTNNHVIETPQGSIQDQFSICYSQSIESIPSCDRTASVVARDPERDIALLRLDHNNIYGEQIGLEDLPQIEIDGTYEPTINDPVQAVGYPDIGAETQTQTSGIISGTQERNNATYIKTDAMISGGNSGGPLLKEGKIVGLNTFTASGYGSSLSYALSSKDIHAFVEKNKNIPSSPTFFKDTFITYMNLLRTGQESGSIKDDLFDITLPTKYRLMGYTPNTSLLYSKSLADRGDISHIIIDRSVTATMEKHEDFLYIIESDGIYSPSYNSLLETEISGLPFYQIVDKTDASKGQADQLKSYVGKLTSTSYLTINLYGESALDTTLFEKNQQYIQEILKNISLSSQEISKVDIVEYADPAISFVSGKQGGNPGSSLFSFGGTPDWKIYLGSLYEDISINIKEQTREDGKDTSIQEIFDTQTQDLETSDKWIITVDGHDGYMYCLDDNAYRRTPQGVEKIMGTCHASIIVPGIKEDESYIVQVDLTADMKHIDIYKMIYGYFIQDYLRIHPDGGETDVIQYLKKIDLPFTDLDGQLQGYEKVLDRLLKYNLIEGDRTFGGDQAITRADFIAYYIHMVYKADDPEMIQDLSRVSIDVLGIDLSSYVRKDTVELFHRTIQAYLAGIPLSELTTQKILDIYQYQDSLHSDEYTQILDREFLTYGKRKIALSEAIQTVSYITDTQVRYHPSVGTMSIPYYIQGTPTFTTRPLYTTEKNIIDLVCNKLSGNQSEGSCDVTLDDAYEVLTYGTMLDYLIGRMDASLFDSSLESKKDEDGYGSFSFGF